VTYVPSLHNARCRRSAGLQRDPDLENCQHCRDLDARWQIVRGAAVQRARTPAPLPEPEEEPVEYVAGPDGSLVPVLSCGEPARAAPTATDRVILGFFRMLGFALLGAALALVLGYVAFLVWVISV
jgi:hypothetical protein